MEQELGQHEANIAGFLEEKEIILHEIEQLDLRQVKFYEKGKHLILAQAPR